MKQRYHENCLKCVVISANGRLLVQLQASRFAVTIHQQQNSQTSTKKPKLSLTLIRDNLVWSCSRFLPVKAGYLFIYLLGVFFLLINQKRSFFALTLRGYTGRTDLIVLASHSSICCAVGCHGSTAACWAGRGSGWVC